MPFPHKHAQGRTVFKIYGTGNPFITLFRVYSPFQVQMPSMEVTHALLVTFANIYDALPTCSESPTTAAAQLES